MKKLIYRIVRKLNYLLDMYELWRIKDDLDMFGSIEED